MPERAVVTLGKTPKSTPFIDVKIFPGLYVKGTKEEERDLEEVLQWHRAIIGPHNIMEIYTTSTGSRWTTYLKHVPLDFVNLENKDVNSFTGLQLAEV